MSITSTEVQFSKYNFELSDRDMLFRQFESYERESEKLVKAGVVLPAYDYCLKCSHTFNLLDAAGAISVTERTGYIASGEEACPALRPCLPCDAGREGFPDAEETEQVNSKRCRQRSGVRMKDP